MGKSSRSISRAARLLPQPGGLESLSPIQIDPFACDLAVADLEESRQFARDPRCRSRDPRPSRDGRSPPRRRPRRCARVHSELRPRSPGSQQPSVRSDRRPRTLCRVGDSGVDHCILGVEATDGIDVPLVPSLKRAPQCRTQGVWIATNRCIRAEVECDINERRHCFGILAPTGSDPFPRTRPTMTARAAQAMDPNT